MNCGVSSVGVGSGVRDGVRTPESRSLSDWFSFIGLGSERQQQQQQKGVSSNHYYCGSNEIGTVGTNRTPETINLNESIDMYYDGFGGDDGDRDDVDTDNNDNVSKVSEVESSISSKQLSYVQCAGQPRISNSKKQSFHRRCHPSTCRMTSGMCVDCAHCFKHCVCGDEGKLLLPVTCDTPDCSHIVCTDCMRCHTHCTCYDSDPIHRNLLRGDDEKSLVAFSPPSIIGTPTTRHRHQSLLNMEIRKKERVGTQKNPKKTPTAAVVLVQQQFELSRRTHSLLSDDDDDDDDDDNNNKDDHGDDNCVTATGNERHRKNNNQVSSYTRILSEDENNSDTKNYKCSISNSSRFHEDVDENGTNAYYAEKLVPPTQSTTSTSPFTTYYEGDSIAWPTRASASTAPHRNNQNPNRRRTTNSAAARTTTASWRHLGNRNRRRKRTI